MTRELLFIGGSGAISAACVRHAIALGDHVTVVNRGRSQLRPLPPETEVLTADIREPESVRAVLGDREFDSVVDFFAFLPEHVETDADLFGGRTGQYVFISSASAYQTPPQQLPVTEDTPLDNPFWEYSRDKIACEQRVAELSTSRGDLPYTIVRPSHTYDETSIPFDGGWTVVDRMRRGLPVVVHGDGTSLWTITHTDDFAVGFVGLLGHPGALGQAIHITNSAPVTWDHIYRSIAAAAGVSDPELVHIASETLARMEPEWGPRLVGDVSHSMIFDNSRVSALVPAFAPNISYAEGARQIVAWYDAHPDQQEIDPAVNDTVDAMVAWARR
ncbi:MAG TPA: NAD-dependent epimerase/dehydratase family protein [Propionibacteriaceae bacterium]